MRKKHDEIVFLVRTKLNSIEVPTSWASVDSYISSNNFVYSYISNNDFVSVKAKEKYVY